MSPKKENTAKAEEVKQGLTVEEIPQTKEETFMDSLDKISEDLQIILREGHKIITVKGPVLIVPPVGGMIEKKAIKLVVDYFRQNTELIKKIFGDADNPEKNGEIVTSDLISFIIDILDDGYEKAQELTAILTEKEVDWVDKNLLAADLVGVILPFTKAEVKPIVKLFAQGNLIQNLGVKMKMAKSQMEKKVGDISGS